MNRKSETEKGKIDERNVCVCVGGGGGGES